MVEDLIYNYVTTYPKTHLIYHKFTVKDKLNIKIILVADITSGKIINKLQSANSNCIFI